MTEYPQATRVFIEPESLNEVYRQRRDRRLAFEAYEEEKLQEDRHGRLAGRRLQRNEQLTEWAEKRREDRREQFARRYQAEQQALMISVADPTGTATDAAVGVVVRDDQAAAEPTRKKLFGDVPSIVGERIVLNRVVDTDADALRDLVENPLVQRYEPAYLFEKQRDDVRETIRLMYDDIFENKKSLILAIRVKETGELAGLAEFYGLRDRLHKVSIGYRLRECWWGNGFATEAARLMVGYLYGETDIQIITATTMVENEASAHVLEKADFIRTARYVEEDWGFPEPAIVDKWFC